MSEHRRVLLIAPHESYRIAPYVEAAQQLGIELLVASQGRHSLITACANGLHIDFSDFDAAIQAITEEHRRQPFVAVIGTDDATVELASCAARYLGLPHNPPAAAAISHRKDLARTCLQQAGIPVPAFRVIDLRRPPEQQIDGLAYPCVIKPLSLSGSRGVIRVNNSDELQQACRRIYPLIRHSTDEESRHQLLVEKYIPGREYAVEGLLHDGELQVLTVFDKPDPMEGPYFEETYYITPSHLSGEQQERVRLTLQSACDAYGLRFGPVHGELRINEQGIWILEVASRTIGGECARLLRFGTGYGLEELVLAQASGQVLVPESQVAAAGVLMIPIPRAGILRRVEGIMTAKQVPFIEDVVVTLRDGYELVPLPEGSSYLGFIFASGPSAREVEQSLRQAHACLKIVTAPALTIQDRRQIPG